MDNKTLFKPGKVIDQKWIIIELIGKGAMGEVYRAHQMNLKRDVAVKIVSEEMLLELEGDEDEIENAFKRFQREVHAMAKVRHTNILNIFDYGKIVHLVSDEEKTIEYIVMEYIEGDTFRFTMSEEGLDDVPDLYASWIEKYFLPVLDGVKAMHIHDIFHRDLKPENIFMDIETPKIADFGLARSYKMKAVSNSLEMKGTLAYMPPEQFSDFKNADRTADIYSLGKILYEAYKGKLDKKTLPFKSVGIDDPETPFLKEMDYIIRKATAENKNERFQSVDELRSGLQKALSLNKESAQEKDSTIVVIKKYNRWLIAGLVTAIISVVSMTLWHLNNNNPSIDHARTELNETYKFPERDKLKDSILGRDGSQMILTGDKLNREENLFYIDKEKISNFLFVDFLNTINEQMIFDNGVIKHNDQIIIYLGTGSDPEDRIIYRHNRFHLIKQEYGTGPVTRVTFHGAAQYAKFFGKDLLNTEEWRSAYKFHLSKVPVNKTGKESEKDEFSAMMHDVKESEKTETMVLDGMGAKYKEWVYLERKDKNQFSGVIDSKKASSNLDAALRYQWEGFKDVGFRTKIKVN